jgi:hypothetical protein
MIPFKKITIGEKVSIDKFIATLEHNEELLNLDTWKNDDDAFYAIVEGRLIFRKLEAHTYIFSMPYGSGPLRYALMQMLEDSTMMGCKCIIKGIPEKHLADFKAAMPGHFDYEINTDGTISALACKSYAFSVFNNNESMVPPPTGELFRK